MISNMTSDCFRDSGSELDFRVALLDWLLTMAREAGLPNYLPIF